MSVTARIVPAIASALRFRYFSILLLTSPTTMLSPVRMVTPVAMAWPQLTPAECVTIAPVLIHTSFAAAGGIGSP